jgi:hypothetical protein
MYFIRSMITEIKVVPCEDGSGMHLELAGDLARLCSTSTMQSAQAVGAGR